MVSKLINIKLINNNYIFNHWMYIVPAPLEVNYKINGVNFLLKWNSVRETNNYLF